jgi:hypothetical protein
MPILTIQFMGHMSTFNIVMLNNSQLPWQQANFISHCACLLLCTYVHLNIPAGKQLLLQWFQHLLNHLKNRCRPASHCTKASGKEPRGTRQARQSQEDKRVLARGSWYRNLGICLLCTLVYVGMQTELLQWRKQQPALCKYIGSVACLSSSDDC